METKAEYNLYIFACNAESDELISIVQNIMTRMRQEELINGIQAE